MHVDQFDFDLPDELIALRPARPRDTARLLAIGPEAAVLRHTDMRALPDLLRPGDVLVFNDTKVVPTRLKGVRDRAGAQARIEVTLHKREGPASWRAFARPAKRLKPGDRILFDDALSAEVTDREGGEVCLHFSCAGPALDEAIGKIGDMPLPPYIAAKRAVDAADAADYQTIFGVTPGAVAAPTAGLHFTADLLDALDARGIGRVTLTLHVGAGTFLPMSVDHTQDHKMHAEWGEISDAAAAQMNAARQAGGRIVAVGTTSLRLLESAATADGVVHSWRGDTDIFITPGYRFRAVDLLMTNFHLPRSTLFMLVAAFRGLDEMKHAYRTAIAERYRFYSYGDACLIHPAFGQRMKADRA